MNCKEGDLAIVVRSIAGNEGKFVTCQRIASDDELKSTRFLALGPVWVIDRALPTNMNSMLALANDCFLRPIRPGDLHETEDERKEVTA